jgi:prophage regulatory protein
MTQTTSPGPLLRLPSVAAQTGLSKSEIYRRIKDGKFPQPIKLGARAVAWPAAQIEAWVNDLIGKSAQ